MLASTWKNLELAFKKHVDVTNWKVGDKDTPTEEALERKKDRREAMGDILVNDKEPISKELLKEVKRECKERVVAFGARTIGISACHPDDNAHNWPPPEGPNALPPPTDGERKCGYQSHQKYSHNYTLYYNEICSKTQNQPYDIQPNYTT